MLTKSSSNSSCGGGGGGHPKSLHKKRLNGGQRPKGRKGDHSDCPASSLDATMTERRAHSGKNRTKAEGADQRHAAASHQVNKMQPPPLLSVPPPPHETPSTHSSKPMQLVVEFSSVSSASPASSVCSYSPPTLSPSPTSSFHTHLVVDTPGAHPAHHQMVFGNFANLNSPAKPELSNKVDDEGHVIKDEWPDFGEDASGKIPQNSTKFYESDHKVDETKKEDLLSEPSVAVEPFLPDTAPEEEDSGCNLSIRSSNVSVPSSLARQTVQENCVYAPLCGSLLQSTPPYQHQHQHHLSPNQYLQFQREQLTKFVKQHQEQKEKQTDKQIFFLFDPPPPPMNVSPTHMSLAPLQMVTSPLTLQRPLYFSPPPFHIHPVRTSLPRQPFSSSPPPPPPPPLPPNLPYNVPTSVTSCGSRKS